MSKKDAIIHFRTTKHLKNQLVEIVREVDGMTLTRLLEEGAEHVLSKYQRTKWSVKS